VHEERRRPVSLGFMKCSPEWPFGNGGRSARQAPAVRLALPTRLRVGYAYVTSRMSTRLTGDPRDVALRDALYSALKRT
jgi:hypothetical protein